MAEKILKVKNLEVTLGGNQILKDINFELDKGSITAVIGPNGAGKSMLFKTLLGIMPYRGEINWIGSEKIGYVPQKFNIDKTVPLTVHEFFKLKTDKDEDIFRVLKDLDISHDEHHTKHHILNRRLGVLSGGEQQKVLVAWAILTNPDILLFDEPTAGVDVGAEHDIYQLLKKLNQERNITVIFISHDINIIRGYAKNVICLNKKMVCYGNPETAINKETLGQLYGEDASVYIHHHDNDH